MVHSLDTKSGGRAIAEAVSRWPESGRVGFVVDKVELGPLHNHNRPAVAAVPSGLILVQ
jgi:hypothetical protein